MNKENNMLEILKRKLVCMNKYLEASTNGIKFIKDHKSLMVNSRAVNALFDTIIADQVQIKDLIKQIIGDV